MAKLEYDPIQLVHELDPAAAAFPASHTRQVSDEVADGVELYRPAAHCVHEAEPSAVEYDPMQLVHELDPAAAAFPASHARHVSDEVADGVEL